MKRILCFILLLICGWYISAQDVIQTDSVAKQKSSFFQKIFKDPAIKHDTSYFQLEQKKLLLRLFCKQKYTGFQLIVPENDYFAKYAVAPDNSLGFGFNYKWLGLNLGYSFPFMNVANNTKNGLKIDLHLQLTFRNWVFDGGLQHLHGYYLRKTSLSPEMELNDNPKIQFNAFSFNGFHVFNHKKFSYKAAYINNCIQKKSAGSLLMGASVYGYSFLSDDNLFPDLEIPQNDTSFVEYNKISSINAFFIAGYSYTFVVFKKMFINVLAVPCLGYGNSQYALGEESWNKSAFAFEAICRAAIGYNDQRFFVSLTGQYTGIYKELPNGFNWNYAGNLRLNFGIKIDVQKKKSSQITD